MSYQSFLQNLYIFITILNSILISYVLFCQKKGGCMDLIFIGIIGIFFGITWLLIERIAVL